jgi:hypothetical protein
MSRYAVDVDIVEMGNEAGDRGRGTARVGTSEEKEEPRRETEDDGQSDSEDEQCRRGEGRRGRLILDVRLRRELDAEREREGALFSAGLGSTHDRGVSET